MSRRHSCFHPIGADHSHISGWIGGEFFDGGVDESDSSGEGPALKMVKSCRQLYQSLIKGLLRLGRLEPQRFPRLVRIPEPGLIEPPDPFREEPGRCGLMLVHA